MGLKTSPAESDPEAQLEGFIAKFDAADQRRIRDVRRALRRRLPTANEMVYDNYNFFVIGYGSTERPSDAILSIAAQAGKIALCLLHGATLPDPHGILRGEGKQTRSIRLESAATLSEPAVEAVIASALSSAKVPLPETGRGQLIVRSVSVKQRPRQKPAVKTAKPRGGRC
ncbi:MAG: DUF1801 domain-containing protein [Vicinamibacterales bacterium]